MYVAEKINKIRLMVACYCAKNSRAKVRLLYVALKEGKCRLVADLPATPPSLPPLVDPWPRPPRHMSTTATASAPSISPYKLLLPHTWECDYSLLASYVSMFQSKWCWWNHIKYCLAFTTIVKISSLWSTSNVTTIGKVYKWQKWHLKWITVISWLLESSF